MSESKKYYWLKLKEDFFRDKTIKKLRKIAGGDTYTIIYLKLMLIALKDEGKLFFEGVEDTFPEEIALEIDEDAENVRFTLLFLEKSGLLQEVSESEMLLTRIPEMIGSETNKAELMRRKRAQNRLQNGNNVTPALPDVTKCYTEIEIDKELELESELELEGISPNQAGDKRPAPPYDDIKNLYNDICRSLPRCTALSNARKRAISARLSSGYTVEDFERVFTKAEASTFLRGGNNRNWTATFDWLIKDANFAKVLDGNYDNAAPNPQPPLNPNRIGDLDEFF